MSRLPPIFSLQTALQVLSDRTDVLPAVGGATEDELRPDADEVDDQRATKDDEVLARVQEIVSKLGAKYELADIEAYGVEGQDLRRRAEDTMRMQMHDLETETLIQVVSLNRPSWVVYDGSLRFAEFFEKFKKTY